MRNYNFFDNVICLLLGGVISVFIYINLFTNKDNKIEIEKVIYKDKPIETIKEVEKIIYQNNPIETIKEVEKIIYKDKIINLTENQKKDLIEKIKTKIIDYSRYNYVYKIDIESILNNIKL